MLAKKGIGVEHLYLFGSYARKQHHADSDIDIAVVSRNLSGNRFKDSLNLFTIAKLIDFRIEPIGYLPKDFLDEDPFVAQIKKYGIEIK